jgi:hypothetical protein
MQRPVSLVDLLQQPRPAAGVAQRGHRQPGQQGCLQPVAHRVGHRHHQRLRLGGVVEGVPTHVIGRLQRPGHRILRRRQRQPWQQLPLDLGWQAQRPTPPGQLHLVGGLASGGQRERQRRDP